ncbi:MAG: ABC transporter substrate-binding protein, partial [Saprospiraceae bacterium]
ENTAHNDKNDIFNITIGIEREPSALFPIKRSADVERQVFQYIFMQCADYDPITLENTPLLLEKFPDKTSIDTGTYKGSYRYDISLRDNAKWDNGSEITGFDYLFTIKMILFPAIELHPSLRALYKHIIGIEINEDNPKKFSVYTDKSYMLSDELVTNMEIFPEYFYDSLKVLREINLSDIINNNINEEILVASELQDFISKINGAYFMRDHISGAGPYKLESWIANNQIVLSKKENWWGQDISDISYFKNYPEKLIFKIIPDKTTEFIELKNGNVDLIQGEFGQDFVSMHKDEKNKDKFNFFDPLSLQYYSLILNNRNKILEDVNVRKALAHLVDVNSLLKTFGTGGEMRMITPVHPEKKYYDKNLTPIDFNIDKAKSLLSEAGWKENNGILEKSIDEKNVKLKLSISITGQSFGKSLALQLKENAAKAGIEIEIITVAGNNYRNMLKNNDFDMTPVIGGSDLADEDPFNDWASANAGVGGTNLSGFHDKECDEIIDKIRNASDKEKRAEYYKEFQKIIYDQQPVIFLYFPTNNIIVDKKYDSFASIKRPGYFANAFTLKK